MKVLSTLLRFHTPRYIDWVRTCSREGSGVLDGGDTPAFRGCFEAAAQEEAAAVGIAELLGVQDVAAGAIEELADPEHDAGPVGAGQGQDLLVAHGRRCAVAGNRQG